VPYDTGGTGGYIPGDRRIVIRARLLNMNLVGNPNYPGGPNTDGANIVYVAGAIDYTFEGCNVPNAQVSMCKHLAFKNVTATWGWEPDKISETLLIDGGATAFDRGSESFFYVRVDSHFLPFRMLRERAVARRARISCPEENSDHEF
jgi:hypothetical protein